MAHYYIGGEINLEALFIHRGLFKSNCSCLCNRGFRPHFSQALIFCRSCTPLWALPTPSGFPHLTLWVLPNTLCGLPNPLLGFAKSPFGFYKIPWVLPTPPGFNIWVLQNPLRVSPSHLLGFTRSTLQLWVLQTSPWVLPNPSGFYNPPFGF